MLTHIAQTHKYYSQKISIMFTTHTHAGTQTMHTRTHIFIQTDASSNAHMRAHLHTYVIIKTIIISTFIVWLYPLKAPRQAIVIIFYHHCVELNENYALVSV